MFFHNRKNTNPVWSIFFNKGVLHVFFYTYSVVYTAFSGKLLRTGTFPGGTFYKELWTAAPRFFHTGYRLPPPFPISGQPRSVWLHFSFIPDMAWWKAFLPTRTIFITFFCADTLKYLFPFLSAMPCIFLFIIWRETAMAWSCPLNI